MQQGRIGSDSYPMINLIAFIESHGFRAIGNSDGTVSFSVPYAFSEATEQHTVHNITEARNALGY